MKFTIEKYPQGLDNLAIITNLDEPVDYTCDFLTARDDRGYLLGAAGVNFYKLEEPRFEHIIVSPKYQKTKLGGILMKRTERWLKDLGYKAFVAYIYNTKTLMIKYAKKFKMKPYKFTDVGTWWYKSLEEGYVLS